jgi:methionyl-tRNA formyltransferase
MRIVFLGFGTWGVESLRGILEAGHDIRLVLTHPESKHEYERIWNDSVLELATEYQIPAIVCSSANREEVACRIEGARPDLLVSSDWRTWLGPRVFNLPKFGSINVHDALLPRYGGFAPINWAIANGEIETGVTVHFIHDDLDLGDIILQRRIEIGFSDTATDVFYRTLPLFSSLLIESIGLIERGQVPRVRQDRSLATFYHKRSERDSLVDWNRSSLEIYNLIRAQSDPYPNAYSHLNGKKLMLKKASLPDRAYRGTPGRVFCRSRDGVVVVCGCSRTSPFHGLVLEQVQEEGAEVLEANEYFRRMGDYLGD